MAAVSELAPEPSQVAGRGRRTGSWLERLGPGGTRGSWDASWLDGVRAVAVLLVVVVHVWADSGASTVKVLGLDLTWVPATMTFGVTIFFVLSGYLLARPWFVAERSGGPLPNAATFWRRRLLRIVPAYYLSIAVVLILFVPAGVIPREAVTGRTGVANLGGQLLFLQGYLPVSSGNLNNIDGAWWSLTVEMTLYLVLPALVPLFLGRRTGPMLFLALVGTVVWTHLATERLDWLVRAMSDTISPATSATLMAPRSEEAMRILLVHAFPTWLFVFAVGIALARLSVAHEVRVRAGSGHTWWQGQRVAAAAVVVGALLVLWTEYHVGTGRRTPFQSVTQGLELQITAPAGLGLILAGLTVAGARARRPLTWGPLRFIGWTSYGIYLFHLPVIAFLHTYTGVGRLGPGQHFVVLLVLDLLLATAAGTASWLLVERPLLRRRTETRTGRTAPIGRTLLAGRRPQLALVLTAALVAAVVVGAATPTPTTRDLTGGLFARGIAPRQVDRELSGRVTLSRAAGRNLMYPAEHDLLTACAAGEGTTTLVVTEQWSAGATAFPCARRAAATTVLRGLAAWEHDAGFRRVSGAGDPVAVFFSDRTPPTPTHPNQFHVRFTSGRWVIGFAIQARSRKAGEEAVTQLCADLSPRLRPQGPVTLTARAG